MSCPANSTAVVENGIVTRCDCIQYHRNVKDGSTYGYPGAPCDIIYHVESVIGYSDVLMTVKNPTYFPDARKYVIKAYKKGSATDIVPVSPADGSTITNMNAPRVHMTNLEPGRR